MPLTFDLELDFDSDSDVDFDSDFDSRKRTIGKRTQETQVQ